LVDSLARLVAPVAAPNTAAEDTTESNSRGKGKRGGNILVFICSILFIHTLSSSVLGFQALTVGVAEEASNLKILNSKTPVTACLNLSVNPNPQ